ncbi:hypothetical protein [Cellulophaga sp. Z1A5H]|uniref:hypothetical protein n=1 Tax=Cellulophaga sp. Z1A5H TaxID=2687291 RepID=UPI0013FDA528|nr:hypothetical protein [Cellulophaga sp. Z1A5H]
MSIKNQLRIKSILILFSLVTLFYSCKNKKNHSTNIAVQEKIDSKKNSIPPETIKKSNSEKTTVIEKFYVNAKNGLIFRDIPRGKILGKFDDGKQIEIVERTSQKMTITDNGEEVSGEWVGVLTEMNEKIVYVFDGFLLSYYGGIIPASTVKLSTFPNLILDEKEVLLFPNKTKKITTYDNKFKPKGTLSIDGISYASQLEISELEHASKPNADYCDYAKFVKVVYKNREYIVFGDNVLNIENIEELNYQNKRIKLIKAVDYSLGSADEDGLTFCADDFSYLLIQENNTISTIGRDNDNIMIYAHNDGVFEKEGKYIILNDSIKTEVSQSFQEGTGKYDLSIFYNDGWDYKISNIKSFYQGEEE